MRWASPACLLLILPALAVLWRARAAVEPRRAAAAFPGVGDILSVDPGAGAWVRGLPLLLRGAALLLFIVALARPQKVFSQAAGLAKGVDILLVLDTSTSMRALDFAPLDRITAAKNAAREFISKRVSDRIGILVFGGDPVLTCPLTLDYEALYGFLDDVSAGMTNSEGTAIGDAIAAAVGHLKDSSAKSKIVILLTDGRNNAGLIDPVTAARTAKSMGIKVYAIGTAKKGEALYPVDHPVLGRTLVKLQDDLDDDALTQIAAEADGRYYRATSSKELSQIYSEIDRLEKSAVKLPELFTYHDLHAWLVLPAVLLLAAELLLSRTALLRVP
ncbi:MAG TPA: VWA domain-containing protein [Elusimicrobiota bacterium]|jgi:Ca-activated chloride channel family protein|nr:VWA domain-containing protein [Elusimicrobiota bacterium]